jgi:hypothetical protein
MTATVEFIVARASNALHVSNSALRFTPTQSMMAELSEIRDREGSADPAQPVAGPSARPSNGEPRSRLSNAEPATRLFYLDDNGDLAVAVVETGITDGQSTVIEGTRIAEGMQIIAAVASGNSATAAPSNPFQSQNESPPRGGPRM